MASRDERGCFPGWLGCMVLFLTQLAGFGLSFVR